MQPNMRCDKCGQMQLDKEKTKKNNFVFECGCRIVNVSCEILTKEEVKQE